MQHKLFRSFIAWSPLALLSVATSVAAQPAALSQRAPATTGDTQVAQEGFKSAEKPAADSKDANSLKIMAGALWTAGNSRTLALTGAGDYRLRRSESQFSALAAVNFGKSAQDAASPYETTVENYQARLRYDYFFADSVAAFLGVSARRDRFQGLNLRLNVDPGVAYYFIDEQLHLLWGELGYDVQYDIRRQDVVDAAAADATVPDIAKSETRHSARAFVGYDNQLSAALKFGTSLEYLQAVQDTTNWRLNWDGALTSQIDSDFSIATTLAVKYEHNPLPGVESTDVVTALNLVYTVQ